MTLIIATAIVFLIMLAGFGIAAHAAWRLYRLVNNARKETHG